MFRLVLSKLNYLYSATIITWFLKAIAISTHLRFWNVKVQHFFVNDNPFFDFCKAKLRFQKTVYAQFPHILAQSFCFTTFNYSHNFFKISGL